MKTSKMIWSIVIAAVIIYLIYKAYTNYQASGSVFRSSALVVTPVSGPIYSENSSSAITYGEYYPDVNVIV